MTTSLSFLKLSTLLLLALVWSSQGFFRPFLPSYRTLQLPSSRASSLTSARSNILRMSSSSTVPETEKSRLFLRVVGQNSVNPLFRAELKKELTFFRGCNAYYSEAGPDSAVIIAEGKTSQLQRFIQWMELFSVALSERKPSFQSPNLVVYIKEKQWETFTGKLSKGFQTKHEAPELEDAVLSRKEGLMEAKNMLGTDESV